MSDQNQNPNENPNLENQTLLSKEDKIKKLQELGIVGKDAVDVIKASHAELDYLIAFNEAKANSQTKEKASEEIIDENASTVPRQKWDDEVIKRRKFESENAELKKKIKNIAESLAGLSK